MGKETFARDGPVVVASRKKIKQKSNNNSHRKNPSEWKSIAQHSETFARWATGQTGFPLVDAAMKELVQTGFCSNRVRQNVASFLSKDLRLDWRAGAEWFQICLADHCVAANYGNWSYFAGTGNDPKNRHFRTISQAMRYDPDGTYVRKWLPALQAQPPPNDDVQACFRPWDYNIEPWPVPMVDVSTQYSWTDMQELENHQQ
uniref:Cryptochrome/DNA photolyase FAD-binding domain-containing protein n=1 Tax=Amphora coffeiformis TaxID=265554 RepID=A0A7S3LA32_9STRA